MRIAELLAFLKRREIFGFHGAVFAGSSLLGILSFGPFALIVLPIIFAVGYGVALVSVAPIIYFLMRRGVRSAYPFVLGSAVIGMLVAWVYAGLPQLISDWKYDIPFNYVPTILLSVPVAMAYGVGGFVYWWMVISRDRAR